MGEVWQRAALVDRQGRILEDARTHFSLEEQLLLQLAYPRAAGHAAVHSQITWEMEYAIKAVRRGSSSQIWGEYGLLVESFIDTLPTADGGAKSGGTLAPTLGLDVQDDQTSLDVEYDYGYNPAMEAVAGR